MERPFNHCGKCKHLRRAKKAKNVGAGSTYGTFFEQMHLYYCEYRWWSDRPVYDTCEHFEHKRAYLKKQDQTL